VVLGQSIGQNSSHIGHSSAATAWASALSAKLS
jgi:hypothetical protein